MRIDGFKEAGKANIGIEGGGPDHRREWEEVDDEDEFGDLMVKTLPEGDSHSEGQPRRQEQEFKVKLVDPPAAAEPRERRVSSIRRGGGHLSLREGQAGLPRRASLGITVITLSDQIRERLGVPVRQGAVITMVRPGSAADRAGVPVDAVVVAMDGQMVATSEELVALISGAEAGCRHGAELLRGRQARPQVREARAGHCHQHLAAGLWWRPATEPGTARCVAAISEQGGKSGGRTDEARPRPGPNPADMWRSRQVQHAAAE